MGLYAYAMNDLGNVQPLQFEALNCKGGARWSSGEKLLEYLKGVCDYIANIKENISYFCPKIWYIYYTGWIYWFDWWS